MIKRFIEPSQDLTKLFIVVDTMPDTMQQVTTLGIHVTTSLCVDTIGRNNRLIISDTLADAMIVFIGSVLTKNIIHKQRFTVIGKSFMHPHISQIFSGDIIAKPLMAAFMNDDKVKL